MKVFLLQEVNMFATHYIDIKTTKIANAVLLDTKKIYQKMHSIIGKSEGKIGVSFPDWSDEEIGSNIRFFGPEEQLQFISRSSWLNNYAEIGILVMSRIKIVPNVNQYIRFFRNRKIEKKGEAYFHRIKKRSISYFEKNNIPIKEVKLPKEYIIQDKFHSIKMKSISTNQDNFGIYIMKETFGKNDFKETAKFSSYGLCQPGIGVPDF
jgi:CRISPR-associated endoribonuclease Cas6/Csy4 subtype I-F